MDLIELSEKVLARVEAAGFENVTAAEKTFAAVWTLEGDVNNGGFDQYFFNAAGDYAPYAPQALREIGANQMAKIVDEANRVFGPAGPPRSQDQRQKALEALGEEREARFSDLDAKIFDYPDDLEALLEAYVEKHSKAFGVED